MRKLKRKSASTAPLNDATPFQVYTSPDQVFDYPTTPIVPGLISDPYAEMYPAELYDPEVRQRLIELRSKNNETLKQADEDYRNYAWDKKIDDYYEKFNESKKSDKISPLESLPIENLTPELEKELKEQGFFIHKTKKTAELYPADIIQRRVIDNGFRENQFSNYWGIDGKQVKQQFGDLFKAADQQYEATVLNKVLSESINTGKSIEETFNSLGSNWGVTSELKKKYLNKSKEELEKIIQQAKQNIQDSTKEAQGNFYDFGQTQSKPGEGLDLITDPKAKEKFDRQLYTNPDGSPNWAAINARQQRKDQASEIFNQGEVKSFSPNLPKAQVSDQFSNLPYYNNSLIKAQTEKNKDAFINEAADKPFKDAQQEQISKEVNKIFTSKINDKINTAISEGDSKKQAEILKNLQSQNFQGIVSDKEINDAFNQQIFDKLNTPTFSTGTNSMPKKELSTLDKIQDVATYFPHALRYSFGKGDVGNMWADQVMYDSRTGEQLSYRDLMELKKQGYDMTLFGDEGNLVGNFLNTFNPIRLGYESRKNVEAGRYGDLALDVATSLSPFYAGKVLSGLGKGVNTALHYSPVKAMPWLNLQNAVINPYFAYESIKPGGLFEEGYEDFSKGNYLSGTGNTLFGVAGLLPYVKPIKELGEAYKTLSTPGGKVAFPTSGKYAFGYKSPQASELFVGNPAIENAVPAFESFTSPLNRFTKSAGLGEFKVMRNETVPLRDKATYFDPLNITTGAAAGSNSATNVKTLDTQVPLYRVEPESAQPFVFGEGPVTKAELAQTAETPVETINAAGDDITSQIINDYRERKIERWSSPEGQRRLQELIDNTPALKEAGYTPETYLNQMVNLTSWNEQKLAVEESLNAAKQQLAQEQAITNSYDETTFANDSELESWLRQRDEVEKPLQETIANYENELSDLNNPDINPLFPKNTAYWDAGENMIGIDAQKVTADDARIITGHEGAHILGYPNKKTKTVTSLDNKLSEIELLDNKQVMNRLLNTNEPRQTALDLNDPSGAAQIYGPQGLGDDYLDKAIEYWNTGGEGVEKTPFAAEVVEDMLQRGIIKSEYDKITPDMLRKHYESYMNDRGKKYPLRIYDIMQDKKKNFNILSEVVNNLPLIAGTALAADALMGDSDNKEEDVSKAGLLMLFGKYGKGSKKAIDIISKLQKGEKIGRIPVIGAAYKFLRSGYDKLSKNEIKLLDQIIDIERIKIEHKLTGDSHSYSPQILDYDFIGSNLSTKAKTKLELDFNSGTIDPIVRDTYIRLGKAKDRFHEQYYGKSKFNTSYDNNATGKSDKYYFDLALSYADNQFIPEGGGSMAIMANELKKIEEERIALINKVATAVNKYDNSYQNALDELIDLTAKLDLYKKEIGTYELKGESIIDAGAYEAPWLKKSIKTGEGTVIDFATGKELPVTNTLPQKSMVYTMTDRNIGDGEEVSKSMESIAGRLDPVAEQTVSNNIQLTVNALPGAKPYGSSVLVADLGIMHLSNDIDVMMTDKDLAKIKGIEYLGKKSPNSPAHQYNVFPNAKDAGVIDVNLIMTGPDGLAMDDPESSVKHATKTFRQFFPIEFAAEAKAAALEKRPIKIPYTAEQLMERFDPVEKSIMDAYESNPDENFTADKQRYRPDVIVSFTAEDKLDKVASGQLKYIQSIVGENGNLGKQFPEEAFSDVKKNIQILTQMNYPGARSVIAKSPKRMQLALNDYYINKTSFVREIDASNFSDVTREQSILSAIQDWDPRYGGGTARGIGTNSQELGVVDHATVVYSNDPLVSFRQLNVIGNGKHADFELNLDDPLDYVLQIKHEMGESFFTPKQQEQLNKIYNETIGKVRNETLPLEKTWLQPNEILEGSSDDARKRIYVSNREADVAIEFLNRINSELGLRAIKSKRNYGTGIYASTISKIDETIDGIMYGAIKSMPRTKSWYQRTVNLGYDALDQYRKAEHQIPVDTLKNFKKVKNLLQSGIKDIDKEIKELNELVKKLDESQSEKVTRYTSKLSKYNELLEKGDSIEQVRDKFNAHVKNLMTQQHLLQKRVDDIKNFKQSLAVFLVATGSLGTAGAFIKALSDKQEEREIRNQKENKKYFDRMLPKMIEKGQGEEFLQDYLETMGPNRRSWRKHKKAKGWNNKKLGGQQTIELELTPEEIKDYIAKGYHVVER